MTRERCQESLAGFSAFALFHFVLPWACLFGSAAPSSAGSGEEAAPCRGGCIFSAGFARDLEEKRAFYKQWLGFASVPQPCIRASQSRRGPAQGWCPPSRPRGARRGVAPHTMAVLAGGGARDALLRPCRLGWGKPRLPPWWTRSAGRDCRRAAAERPGRAGSCLCRERTHATPLRAPTRCHASPACSRDCFTGLGPLTGAAGGGEQPGASSLMLLQNGLGGVIVQPRTRAPCLPLQQRRAASGLRGKMEGTPRPLPKGKRRVKRGAGL